MGGTISWEGEDLLPPWTLFKGGAPPWAHKEGGESGIFDLGGVAPPLGPQGGGGEFGISEFRI